MSREFMKRQIANQIRIMTGSDRPPTAFLEPAGDAGWFGPSSMTWRVHAHFVSMLVGGLSSLLIQALHPSALAGVWDHSNFRTDIRARLGRTAYFIAATTYGGQAMAQAAIDRVNHIHDQVVGKLPNGMGYRARDPHLLRWVHLAEVLSFLQAYTTYGDTSLPLFAQNQYIAEMKQIGAALGANDLPETVQSAHAQLLGYQNELVVDERVATVVALIESFPSRPQDKPLVALIIRAAFDNLPQWVLHKLGRMPRSPWSSALTRQALALASMPLQWTLETEGVAAYAQRRLSTAEPSHFRT